MLLPRGDEYVAAVQNPRTAFGDAELRDCVPESDQFGIPKPYSGGFTSGHYGCPERRRHALQIEINRGLYMDERNYRRKPGFARLAADMTELIEHLGEVVRDCLSHAAKYRGLPGKPFESVHPRD